MALRKQNQTILVVDDYSAVHTLVKVFLELEGYQVLTANCAESALKLYREHHSVVALLLTDVEMPDVSGLELADRALQLEPKLKVLFMSALEGASRGYGCLSKPFTQAELIGRVGEVLALRPEAKYAVA
jgi:CheY-like chemotaxis protein